MVMSDAATGKRKGGLPKFVPTEDEREFVYLMCAVGYSHTRIVDYISNKRGGKLGLRTFHRHFKKEIALSQTGVDKMVYRSLLAAAKRGERWAVQLWLEQRCHPLDRGAWRCRPDTAVMVGLQTQPNDLPPVNLVVQFERPDLDAKPWLKKPSVMDLAQIDPPRALPPETAGGETRETEPLSFDGDVSYEAGSHVEPVRRKTVGTKVVNDPARPTHSDYPPAGARSRRHWMSGGYSNSKSSVGG